MKRSKITLNKMTMFIHVSVKVFGLGQVRKKVEIFFQYMCKPAFRGEIWLLEIKKALTSSASKGCGE